MRGDLDPIYVAARSGLLDALDALIDHQSSLIVVGAQAVYLHCQDDDLPVAPYTTDADLVVNVELLSDEPKLADLLAAAGFSLKRRPGIWINADQYEVDLLVPEKLGGKGRRELPPNWWTG